MLFAQIHHKAIVQKHMRIRNAESEVEYELKDTHNTQIKTNHWNIWVFRFYR